jgi:hypothetical protein
MTNRQIKVKMREKTGFYKMRAGERETSEMRENHAKCGRLGRSANIRFFNKNQIFLAEAQCS